MSLKASTGLRNSMLNGPGLKPSIDNGKILVFGGTVPATADAAIGSATLLTTITLNGTGSGITMQTAANGIAAKTTIEVWKGNNVATGVAVFYRHVGAGDDGLSSSTEPRLQGTCGQSGADLNLTAGTNLTAGVDTPVDSYTIELPAGG